MAMKLKKLEWILLGILIAGCIIGGIFLYMPKQGQTVAIISVDGEEYLRLNLSKQSDRTFSIQAETGKPVEFEIKEGAIRFINVNCPDHLCEKAGWCDAPGERAVCLPNRTTLICYENSEV